MIGKKYWKNWNNWAFSSAVERFSDKEEVDGPTPSVPTAIDFIFFDII